MNFNSEKQFNEFYNFLIQAHTRNLHPYPAQQWYASNGFLKTETQDNLHDKPFIHRCDGSIALPLLYQHQHFRKRENSTNAVYSPIYIVRPKANVFTPYPRKYYYGSSHTGVF